MTAQIIQFIPRPNPSRKPLEKQAAEILSQIDTGDELYRSPSKPYQAPEKDPA